MSETTTNLLGFVLDWAPISRVRRNHGLEHATLHVLGGQHPQSGMGGISDLGGFWIISDLSTEEVCAATQEALQRLRNGEERLAVHPNCGTNFATAGILAGLSAFIVLLGSGRRFRDKVERLPLAASFATLALILAQPLGYTLQARFTTSGRPGKLKVTHVLSSKLGPLMLHRVRTER